jgi:hypothetical protein
VTGTGRTGTFIIRAIVAAIAAASPVTAGPSWVTEYPRVAAQAEQDCAVARLEACRAQLLRLYELLDGRADLSYRLAKVEAQLGHDAESLRWLGQYARSGLGFGDPAQQPEFHELRSDPRFAALAATYRAGLEPEGRHGVVAVLPAQDLIAEDIGTDPRDGSRYLSSVHEGRVLRLDAGGQWSDFATRSELDAWGLYALVVDPGRGKLWLGSAAGAVSPPFRPDDKGRSAVLRVDLASRRVERRYELADGREHAFGDMALAADGTLYVADGLGGGVYRISPGARAQLEPVVPPGLMRSPQTPAPVPGGARLLVPDYSRGIAILDLRQRQRQRLTWLEHPPELALYGIDGLYLRGHVLIAVQNGTVPERLLLLHLDTALTRVVKWEVALARAPGLGDPTHGVMAGREFQFIANSGWDRVDDDGRMRAGGEAGSPAIWSIELPE